MAKFMHINFLNPPMLIPSLVMIMHTTMPYTHYSFAVHR